MRTRFWALGWKGHALWWMLAKDGSLVSDTSGCQRKVMTFKTRDAAESRRFFIMTKCAGEKLGRFMAFDPENLNVLRIRVVRIFSMVSVLGVEPD